MGEYTEFGQAFKFTHSQKSSFWDLYGNEGKLDVLTSDELHAIEIVGDKASSEVADFLESIRESLIKKCEEYGYGVKSKSSRGKHENDWTCYFSITKSKRVNSNKILQVWFNLDVDDYILRRCIWLENNRDKNKKLQEYWSVFDNCHITSKSEGGDWWDSGCLAFSNIPLDASSNPALYVKIMNEWFVKLFCDKKWLNVLDGKDK
jgi:hypothetical protein